jgi:hypothetical protein
LSRAGNPPCLIYLTPKQDASKSGNILLPLPYH